MQQHPKIYENVFSSDQPNSRTSLKLEQISAGEMSLNEYRKRWQFLLNGTYSRMFDDLLRLSWLRRSFCYYGKKTVLPMQKNDRLLNSSFVKFMRRHVGKDLQFLTRNRAFNKLESYFDELFPEFMERDPFVEPGYYTYPFRNITIHYMIVVYQLDERIEFLKYADEYDMSYAVFVDFMINYVSCENDRLGRIRYTMKQNYDRNFPFTIKDTDKDLIARKGKKRNGNKT